MKIDQKVLNETFKANVWKSEKEQHDDVVKLADDFLKKFRAKSSLYVNAHVELYIKHLEEKADLLINTLLEIIGHDIFVDDVIQEDALNNMNSVMESEIKAYSKMLRAVMTSIRLDQNGISMIHLEDFKQRCQEVVEKKANKMKMKIAKINLRCSR